MGRTIFMDDIYLGSSQIDPEQCQSGSLELLHQQF